MGSQDFKRKAIRGVAVAVSLTLASVSLVARAHAGESAAEPAWSEQTLGYVNFNNEEDQRKKSKKDGHDDRDYYRINEDGIITGKDFEDVPELNPLMAALYEHDLEKNPQQLDPSKTPNQLRTEHHQELEDRRMAVLILNRILSHEAMKQKIEPQVPEARVDYIMRSILIQASAKYKLLKAHSLLDHDKDFKSWKFKKVWVMDTPESTTCHQVYAVDSHGELKDDLALELDPSLRSNEEMYDWLKSQVGQRRFNFETDWTYDKLGLSEDLAHLHDKPDLGWPTEAKQIHRWATKNTPPASPNDRDTAVDDIAVVPTHSFENSDDPAKSVGTFCKPVVQEQAVHMVFEPFPATWQAFHDQIRDKLQVTYRQQMLEMVWRALLQDRNPLLNWQSRFVATGAQMQMMYDAQKDSQVVQIPRFRASLTEVTASGARSVEFKRHYLALLDVAEETASEEFKRVVPASKSDPRKLSAWFARLPELRRSAQDKAYRQSVFDFALAIASGQLHVSSVERKIERSALDQAPEGDSFEVAERNAAFDRDFFTRRPIVHLDGTDGVGTDASIKIVTMTDLQPIPEHHEKDDPRVHAFLKRQLENKLVGLAFRQLAFELFTRNRFVFTNNFCHDMAWPCSFADQENVAPRLLAEALFPEKLYPGVKMPALYQVANAQGALEDTADVKGQTARFSSTLGHPELSGRVQEIQIDNLSAVFGVSNEHLDYDIQFHND